MSLLSTTILEPDDPLEVILRKLEVRVAFYRETAATHGPFFLYFDYEEGAARLERLLPRLRAALADPTLADDVRLETIATWAEDVHESALAVVAMSHHIHHVDDATRARWEREGATESMAQLARNLEATRPRALEYLTTEEKAEFRARGFLREGE